MRIENYFQKIHETIQSCPLVQLTDISYNKRGSCEGFIRGELYFVDESKLHLREFVDVETTPDRLMYAETKIEVRSINRENRWCQPMASGPTIRM